MELISIAVVVEFVVEFVVVVVVVAVVVVVVVEFVVVIVVVVVVEFVVAVVVVVVEFVVVVVVVVLAESSFWSHFRLRMTTSGGGSGLRSRGPSARTRGRGPWPPSGSIGRRTRGLKVSQKFGLKFSSHFGPPPPLAPTVL